MNLRKFLDELEGDIDDRYAETRAAEIVNEVSPHMARLGHAALVREWTPAAQVIEVRRYLAECIAATAEKQTAVERPYTVVQAAEVLGVSKEKVYALCDSGELACTRIGRRITIQRSVLERFQKLPARSAVQYRHLK